MHLILFILKYFKISHKLTYSKTMKSDIVGAAFSFILGLFVAYLTLSSFGGSSIDLLDVFIFIFYILLLFIIYFKYNDYVSH